MDPLVYPRERTLAAVTLALGLLFWVALVVGTIGIALLYVLFGFIAYLFVQSGFIAYIRGTGVRLSEAQLPDLHARYLACCRTLKIDTPPAAYVLHGDGLFNAFATRFLGRDFVILLSDVIDAMADHPDGVDFYIGHELGHVRMKHLTGWKWRAPALWLPLLGAAYARARESTCDLHGKACSSSPENAARAMLALAAGAKRWREVDLPGYVQQTGHARGFWMSYHELIGGYPWLTKRVARVLGSEVPRRHGLAWALALFTPFGGRSGAAGPLMLVAIVGILAAIALPAYQDYTARAKLAQAYDAAQPATKALAAYYESKEEVPETLEAAGASSQLPGQLGRLEFDPSTMSVTVSTPAGDLLLEPQVGDDKRVIWTCSPGLGLQASRAPIACRGTSPR